MIKQNIKIKGKIAAKFYDQQSLNWAQKLWNRIVAKLNLKRWYILGKFKRTEVLNNIICNAGIGAHIRRLAHDPTYIGYITHMCLGTGAVPAGKPDGTETTLYTEHYRNTTASFTSSGRKVFLTAFFTEAEVSGAFTNFGNVIDGSATANTGQLWTLVAVNWTKSLNEALVIDCEYEFSSI